MSNNDHPSGVPRPVDPKPVSNYGPSYANAHGHRGGRGAQQRAAPVQRRSVQRSMHSDSKPSSDATTGAAAASASSSSSEHKSGPSRPKSGQAVIKGVLSGDTLLLRLPSPQGTVPEEMTLSLTGINAPRLGRGARGTDEPWACHAREFLLDQVLGKVCTFSIAFSDAKSGKEFGTVTVDGNVNVSELVVSAGWASVSTSSTRKDGTLHPERQALADLMERAKEEGIGMWYGQKYTPRAVPAAAAAASGSAAAPASGGDAAAPSAAKKKKKKKKKKKSTNAATGNPPQQQQQQQSQEQKQQNKQKKASTGPVANVRNMTWNLGKESRAFLNAHKGKLIPAIVDRIQDGSTYRVELIPDPQKPMDRVMLLLHLAGVQAPRTPPPLSVLKRQYEADLRRDPNTKKKPPTKAETPPPFAIAAKEFVEQRLLHRRVHVALQGLDKNDNFFGSIVFPKGNISVELLKNGLAKYVPWSGSLTTCDEDLKAAECAAKAGRWNMWRNFKGDATTAGPSMSASGVTLGFTGRVTQVLSADSIVVEDAKGNEHRVVMSSVQAPRMGNPRFGEDPQPWALEGREFTRKRLIGKKVHVTVEYTRQAPAASSDKTPRAYCAVAQGNANVAEEVVAAGFATVVRHRVDEPRSLAYDALVAAEDRARKAKKGVHSNKAPTEKPPVDLTERVRPEDKTEEAKEKAENDQRLLSAKAKQFLPFLQKERALRGIVEYVFTGSRLKVHIPKHNCIISFAMEGVRCPSASSRGKDKKVDPVGVEALAYTRRLLQQHEVRLEIEAIDRGDNFIGNVFISGSNPAVTLLERGYAQTFGYSAERSKYSAELFAAEEKARDARIGVWKDWTPPTEVPADADDADEKEDAAPKEKRIRVTVTEIVDIGRFYVHEEGDATVATVEEHMKAFKDAPADESFQPKNGTICAGLFAADGAFYRVRIVNQTESGEFNVFFIDYGNHDILPASALRAITDESLARIQPIARECTLAALKAPPVDSDYYGDSVHMFHDAVWDRVLLAKVLGQDDGKLHVQLQVDANADRTIDEQLLEAGMARIVNLSRKRGMRGKKRLQDVARELEPVQQRAIDAHAGLWEYGEVSDPDEADKDDRMFPPRDDKAKAAAAENKK